MQVQASTDPAARQCKDRPPQKHRGPATPAATVHQYTLSRLERGGSHCMSSAQWEGPNHGTEHHKYSKSIAVAIDDWRPNLPGQVKAQTTATS